MKKSIQVLSVLLLAFALIMTACEGPVGPAGEMGQAGGGAGGGGNVPAVFSPTASP
jgi:predicted small secreted protein